MARLRIDKPIRAGLLDQLVARGIAPLTPQGGTILESDPDERGGWLTVPDADLAQAQAAIAAHDAAAIDAGEAQKANLLKDAKATLRTYYVQSPATITNAQSVAAIKALIVAVRALAQLDN